MGRYRRTVSFPNPIGLGRPNAKSLHVRSASLPCARSSPLIPQLRDEINELWSWDRANVGSGQAYDGLARIKGILDSLDDVLQLPLTQESLSTSTPLIEKLLEDFLKFVDVYGIFQASILGLKQELMGAQGAIRRNDIQKLGLHVKAQKKIANEISKLVSVVGSPTAETPDQSSRFNLDDMEEVRRLIKDVHRLTAYVSAGLFYRVSASLRSGRKPILVGLGFGLSRKVKKGDEGIKEFKEVLEGMESLIMELRKKEECDPKSEERRRGVLRGMQEMEDYIGEMEKGSERVFRCLLSTRVSLLNILTHA